MGPAGSVVQLPPRGCVPLQGLVLNNGTREDDGMSCPTPQVELLFLVLPQGTLPAFQWGQGQVSLPGSGIGSESGCTPALWLWLLCVAPVKPAKLEHGWGCGVEHQG